MPAGEGAPAASRPTSGGTVTLPRRDPPAPPATDAPPSPAPDLAAELAAAATAAGCIPEAAPGNTPEGDAPAGDAPAGDAPADDPAVLCHDPVAHYPGAAAECTARWCESPILPIQTCSRVYMTFAGGHHYRISGPGFDADFFFIPVSPEFLSSELPVKENFGGVQLKLELGDTSEPAEPAHAVVLEAEVSAEAAFAQGLDVVDGTIIGRLQLDSEQLGVLGPLYHPACDFGTDELGRRIPGACACRFPSAVITIPLYVPLAPLFEYAPAGEPSGEPAAPDAGALP